MLVDKDAHQRETIAKWPIWLALNNINKGDVNNGGRVVLIVSP